jgi:hypothetical protein
MSNIYDVMLAAVQTHWKAHANQYPQKIVLSRRQHEDLLRQRKIGRIALAADGEPETDRFLGAVIEIDDQSPGQVFAVDGSVTPLPSLA